MWDSANGGAGANGEDEETSQLLPKVLSRIVFCNILALLHPASPEQSDIAYLPKSRRMRAAQTSTLGGTCKQRAERALAQHVPLGQSMWQPARPGLPAVHKA